MKTLKSYLILATVTFVLALGVVATLMYFKPTIVLPLPHGTDSLTVAQDTTHVVARDTIKKGGTAPRKGETILAIQWKDSVTILLKELAAREKTIAELERRIIKQHATTDSLKHVREMQYAKLLEAMSAEEAAKVLANMKDSEIKSILLKIKTKQAGKILAALEPKRVARLMK